MVAGEATAGGCGDSGEAGGVDIEYHAGAIVAAVGTETEYGGEMCKEP